MNQQEYDVLEEIFSAGTQTSKRLLYAISIVCALVAHTGVVPRDCRFLGFEFPGMTESLVVRALFVIASVSLFSFMVQAFADYMRYRFVRDKLYLQRARNLQEAMYTRPEELDEHEHHRNELKEETGYTGLSSPKWVLFAVARLRIFLDGVLPFSVALGSNVYLYRSGLL